MSAGVREIPSRFLLQWHLTERCDRRCRHCYQGSTPGAELEWSQLLEVLAGFQELLDHWRRGGAPVAARITVTGGEPFLREDFPRFMERLATDRERHSFAVLCNGGAVDQAMAGCLARWGVDFVQVSVDGAPERHDALRGEGDFVRVERAVRRLKAAGVRTVVSFTAHSGNVGEFPWVARWAWRLGVDRLWADRLIPLGGAASWPDAMLSPGATRAFMEVMEAVGRSWPRRIWPRGEVSMRRALQFLTGGGNPYRCTAGESLLAIMPDGAVLPCRRLPLVVGNALAAGGLRRIYDENDLLWELRRVEPEGCRGCRFAMACRGGLRCLAYAATGELAQRDPGCWLVPGPGSG